MTDNNILYFEWDVENWSKVLPVWEETLKSKPYKNALELGSRNGGLSLWLAQNYELDVISSDLYSPEKGAGKLHDKQKLKGTIKYRSIDVLNIDFKDETFDIIIFKSVLGALSTYNNQTKAMREIYRVLKPGGVLLFAENLQSSWMHRFARQLFIKWSKRWRYLHLFEIIDLMGMYKEHKIKTAGFLSIFFSVNLRGIGQTIDNFLDQKNIFPRMKYIAFGYGVKE